MLLGPLQTCVRRNQGANLAGTVVCTVEKLGPANKPPSIRAQNQRIPKLARIARKPMMCQKSLQLIRRAGRTLLCLMSGNVSSIYQCFVWAVQVGIYCSKQRSLSGSNGSAMDVWATWTHLRNPVVNVGLSGRSGSTEDHGKPT